MGTFDVFMSYAREERHLAEPVRIGLESLGLRVFVDLENGIYAGEAFPKRITNAIRDCKVVVACWTPYALDRDWCRKECLLAYQLGKLVPLALQPLSPMDLGSEFIDVAYAPLRDFSGQSHHLGWSEALKAIARQMNAWVELEQEPLKAATTASIVAQIKLASLAARPAIESPPVNTVRPGASPIRGETLSQSTWEANEARLGEIEAEQRYRRIEEDYTRIRNAIETVNNVPGYSNAQALYLTDLFQSDKYWKAVTAWAAVAGTTGFLSWWFLRQLFPITTFQFAGAESTAAALALIGTVLFKVVMKKPQAVPVDRAALSMARHELGLMSHIKARHEQLLGITYSRSQFYTLPGETKLPDEFVQLEHTVSEANMIRLDSKGFLSPTSEYFAHSVRDFLVLTFGGAAIAAILHLYGGFVLSWAAAPGLAILHALTLAGLGPFTVRIVALACVAGPVLAIVIANRIDVGYDIWDNTRAGILWYFGIATAIWLSYLSFQWFSAKHPVDDLYRAVLGIP